jgi:hypothetical protein
VKMKDHRCLPATFLDEKFSTDVPTTFERFEINFYWNTYDAFRHEKPHMGIIENKTYRFLDTLNTHLTSQWREDLFDSTWKFPLWH